SRTLFRFETESFFPSTMSSAFSGIFTNVLRPGINRNLKGRAPWRLCPRILRKESFRRQHWLRFTDARHAMFPGLVAAQNFDFHPQEKDRDFSFCQQGE